MVTTQNTVWQAQPSQITNLLVFILCALTFWLIIPIFIGLWYYFVVKSEKYILTDKTLTLHTGVINKEINDVELYRIKDIQLKRPLFLRLFGLGTIYLITSDHTNPNVQLRAISSSEELRSNLRNLVETARKERGVREFDTN